MALILFAAADERSVQGRKVYEALAISEVMALAEQHPASHIVITFGR